MSPNARHLYRTTSVVQYLLYYSSKYCVFFKKENNHAEGWSHGWIIPIDNRHLSLLLSLLLFFLASCLLLLCSTALAASWSWSLAASSWSFVLGRVVLFEYLNVSKLPSRYTCIYGACVWVCRCVSVCVCSSSTVLNDLRSACLSIKNVVCPMPHDTLCECRTR